MLPVCGCETEISHLCVTDMAMACGSGGQQVDRKTEGEFQRGS